jgi:hypothetical protein
MPDQLEVTPFQIDHIIARKHDGSSSEDNLAFSCFYCNTHKGPNIAGVDPDTNEIVRLFNPRRDNWSAHFSWSGAVLTGQTAIGRTTIQVLRINDPEYVQVRKSLIAEGSFPPIDRDQPANLISGGSV